MPLTSLPNELLYQIATSLDLRDALHLTATSRNLYARVTPLIPTIALSDHVRSSPARRSALRRACAADAAAVVLRLLRLRPSAAAAWLSDGFGLETPLHVAAAHGSVRVARLLLLLGADVNARDVADVSPLHCAAAGYAFAGGHPDMLRLLIDHGAEVASRAKGGAEPLLFACVAGNTRVIELLLNHGAVLEVGNRWGYRPLQFLGWKGRAWCWYSAVCRMLKGLR